MLTILARTSFRLQERLLNRPTFAVLSQLEQSQWWPTEQLEALRFSRLKDLISTAYRHSSYWRSVMDDNGIAPDSIASLDDLRRFPLLDKETIRHRREDMAWLDEGKRLQLIRTSGSTNEALQFYTNSNREAQINAARIRGHNWIGVEKGRKEMYFWGSPIELGKQDRLKHIRDFFVNDGLANGFELSPERIAAYFDYWLQWRPVCIFGYPSSFVLMVEMAAKQNLKLSRLRDRGLKVISTTSEMLSDVDRELICEAFGVGVYDSYGLREAGLVGHECERHTMHTMDEQLVLETVDPQTLQPTAGQGELVITSMISSVMPVIRYRSGDIVELSDAPCPCGRSLKSIAVSGGRAVEFVVTNKGKWVVGYSFIYICRSVKGIVKFQVLQDRIGEIRVLLVTDERFGPTGVDDVTQAVRKRLDSDDRIIVELVDDISPAPSGKYRPVISKVAEQLRAAGSYDSTR